MMWVKGKFRIEMGMCDYLRTRNRENYGGEEYTLELFE